MTDSNKPASVSSASPSGFAAITAISIYNPRAMSQRMRLPCFAAGLCALTLFSGCVSGTMKQGLNGADKPGLLSTAHLTNYNYTNKDDPNYYLKVYEDAGAGLPANEVDAKRQAARNKILFDLKGVIDNNYYDFEDGLRVDVSVKNTSADIVTLGLTAAATAVGAKEVKTILAAIATGVVGVNTSLDKNIFQSNTVQALQLEMRTLRANIEVNLNHGMNDTDSVYPLQQGIGDIIAYYYAGSITDALLGLVKETGASDQSSQTAATVARKEKVDVEAAAPR